MKEETYANELLKFFFSTRAREFQRVYTCWNKFVELFKKEEKQAQQKMAKILSPSNQM